ncbi:hypothetical protein, partial [Crocosphaera sp.]|uniref:hypothetical protein n=1 Tax=Crocosphaera sp. TaxID=2729996 RepID=UPI00262390D3
MSSSRDHSNSIFIQITRENAISEILEGWQYWLDLGLISEDGVPAKLVGGNDSFKVNFKTTLTITNIIQQLRLLEEVDSFNEGKKITLSIKISASDPLLLQGLDRWIQLGLLTDKQIKDIARQDLSFPVVIIPRKTETLTPVNPPPTSSLPIPKSQTSNSPKQRQKATNSTPNSQVPNSPKQRQKATNSPPDSQDMRVRKKTRRTPKITQIVQSLMAELSVIWLLLLGVFMVVVSSGVIAASWWEKFPAVLQYGILWLYTLGFGFASWWTGKKANLQLTTQGLRIVTLLLVPINFLAMDTFPLWDSLLGLVIMLVGSLSLTILTVNCFKNQNRSTSNFLPFLNHLGLTYLQWGWTFPVIPLLATYIGVIGTTIITLISPKNSSRNNHKFLPFSLSEGIIIYALIIVLVRAIFIAQVNPFQLSLAIGLCGWLMGWRSPPKTGWKLIGSGLLTLGWLLSVFVIPSQAIAISLLAIIWLGRRLKYSGSRRDFFIIFLIGLQIHWLLLRVAIFQPIWSNIIDFTNTSNQSFVLSSIILFPYLFIIVLVRHWWLKKSKIKLYNFSGELLFLFGFILTAISLINPLVRTVNLTLSTLTLAYETRHKLRNNRPFLLKPLALITPISLLLTLTSGINYYFPELPINIWSLIFLGLMIIEVLVSLITFPEESLLQLFNNNSWNIGLSLATLSYVILWFYLPLNSVFWGLIWLIVPSLLTAIATWYLPRKKQASELSVIAICLLQALTIYFPETQLIGLVTGTVLMIINTQYLRHLYSVIITVGLGLTAILSYLYILGLSPSILLLSGVIITLILWFIRHVLHDNTSDLTVTYAQTFDSYAYILSTIILTRLIDVSLVHTSTTNTLISSILLMGSVAYRSWQPLIRNNRIPLLYSIVILAVVPIPALSLPLWGWIELGIATILMMVQTQIFKQVDLAFISIGFILEFIVVILEDNGLKYGEQFWIYWSLLAAVITILFWIIYNALNYFQVHSIDYYKKALNLWSISLCTITVGTITVGRLTSDYLLNNDLILLITINLLMIGAAYRSWQKPQKNSLLWFSIVITLILQLSNPNLLIPKNITPVNGTILLFINSYFLPHFSTAFITMGMAIFSHSLIVLTLTEILKLPTIPIWILTESLTLTLFWLIWSYLKQKTQPLATIYAKAVDTWGFIISGVLLVAVSIDRLTTYS